MKHKRAVVFVGLLLLTGLVWGLVMYYCIPEWWFGAYPAIPASFVAICLVEHLLLVADNRQEKKWMHILMVQRMIRWGILLLTLVLLIVLAAPPRLALLLSFMGFFILYSLLSVLSLNKR